MGRCGPKGSRAAVARRQDGRTDGTADAHGGGGARGDRPRPAQPLGVRWGYTGQASVAAFQLLAPRAGALRGWKDVRIHDLRHSFASRALALGESLNMIGRLLGHTDIASTARYAHLVRDAEKVAAAKVGDSIEADILRTESAAQRAEA